MNLKKNKVIIGYTTGVFDLFHIGHLNILRNAKSVCDKLIVGVTTDEYVMEYKKKSNVIPFVERAEIVKNIIYVDTVVPQDNHNKIETWRKLKFDIMIVGDDWYNTEKWNNFEKEFTKVGVKIMYFPRTEGTNSSLLKKKLL